MYVFDNAAPQAASRAGRLAEVFDPGTIRHLVARGVGPRVGGASKSEAASARSRRGCRSASARRERVLTTDIDTRHLRHVQPSGTWRSDEHDIVADQLPEGAPSTSPTPGSCSSISADPGRALARMVAGAQARRMASSLGISRVACHSAPRHDVDSISKTEHAAMRQVTRAAGRRPPLGRSLGTPHFGVRVWRMSMAEGRVWSCGRGGSSRRGTLRLNVEQLRAADSREGASSRSRSSRPIWRLWTARRSRCARPILWSAWGQTAMCHDQRLAGRAP